MLWEHRKENAYLCPEEVLIEVVRFMLVGIMGLTSPAQVEGEEIVLHGGESASDMYL